MSRRAGLENAADALRGLSPGLVKQLLPIFDQLTPIYMDVAQVRRICCAATHHLVTGYRTLACA
jgi:hypothetical protein